VAWLGGRRASKGLPGPHGTPAGRILVEWAAGAALSAVTLLAIRGLVFPGHGHALFAVIGSLFYSLVLWGPVLLLCRAGSLDGHVRLGARAVACVLLGVGAFATLVEPDWLEARHEVVVSGSLPHGEIRIAHVSDLQLVGFGGRERACVEAVNSFRPHFVVLSGDYVSAPWLDDGPIAAAREVIGSMRPLVGTVAVSSDSDDGAQRRRIFAGLPVSYLENESVVFAVDGMRVRIVGLDHRRVDVEGALGPRRVGGSPESETLLIVSHRPDDLWRLPPRAQGAALLFCGHTHGGQIQVPGFGPLLTLTGVPRRVAAGGMFETPDGIPLSLSRGVGMEGGFAPRFRLFCRPEVVLVTLRSRASTSTTGAGGGR
jgi:predicted MPP superfamily phosphohydrolase